ncbi:hypothetical protein EMPS_08061 [Entomortierella parvispora]|uniref:PXA domain-containing protein n=1 Tax=Entomortierella parvispora TaxID=205924 RepID=A0A9P3HFP1_9FUNG|nr:hypothetical protein EMPS_08061 [Entomortierella parvispora]
MVWGLDVVNKSDNVQDDTASTKPTSIPAATCDKSMEPADSSASVHNPPQAIRDSCDMARNLDIEFALDWLYSRTRGEQALFAATVLLLSRLWLSTLNWGIVLAAILGASLGGFMVAFYLLAVPEDTRLKRASVVAKMGQYKSLHIEMVDGLPSLSDAKELKAADHSFGIHLTEVKDENYDKVDISPDIDPLVEDMISFTLRDFVNVPVGLTSEGHHNIPLRKSLVTMAMNVSKKFSNVRLPETALLAVFGLQNSFIVHLRAYRELRASRQPIEEYVKENANPDSVIGRCYHKDERLKQFRSTAKAICQSLLSKNDQQSIALFSVMQEIMATHVLETTLEHLCDPDFINLSIIDYFSTPAETSTATIGTTGSKINGPDASSSRDTTSTSKEEPITSLADSILMNAATLMDQSTLDKQASNHGLRETIQTPSASPKWQQKAQSESQPAPLIREAGGLDLQETSKLGPLIPEKVTLELVLTNKNAHMDLYQEFMEYLQLWDAMDLAQFWLMMEIFHRQIEQGTLSDTDDLRREAKSIHDCFCSLDIRQNVAGIHEAKGGALLKNMRSSIQSDPATCFHEAQDWALNVLEAQYWTPFEMKKSTLQSDQIHKQASMQASQPSPTKSSSSSLRLLSPLVQEQEASLDTTRPAIDSIHMTDIVNRRPKTLMTNSELSYMIEIQTRGGQGWMVTRSFQQLEQLQLALLQQYPVVQRTAFPRWRLQPSDKVCNGLQAFLRAMLTIPDVASSVKLSCFLSKEFDGNTEEPTPPGLSNVLLPGLLPSLTPVADQTKSFGEAAAQGAKTAMRQASEASLSAGRFFKSLGASSPQLVDEKRSKGSFDSVRSVNSSSSVMTHSDHQLPFAPSRSMDFDLNFDVRQSGSSELTYVDNTLTNSGDTRGAKDVLGRTVAKKVSASSLDDTADLSEGLSSEDSKESITKATMPKTAVETDPTSTLAVHEAPTVFKPKETPKTKFLSTDELDLLIETSFTVLEDMMDFSKGQSIRRMTFGMLRELVRKSYRVAINQSFSAWVEQTTNHEKVVEMVRWMKDDFFWPNEVWPAPATVSPQTSIPPTSMAGCMEKDVLQVGGEHYEVGIDGIAVKVSAAGPRSTQVNSERTSEPPSSPPATRTLKDREETRDKARELVKMMLPGSLVTVLGKEAVLRGLVDVFEMFQIKELNLGLALSILEMTVRLVLTR